MSETEDDVIGNIGHNGGPEMNTANRLKSFIERVERLEEDKAGIATDIKEVYSEAKGEGFDTKTIRKIIAIRKQDQEKREEEESLLETYMHALGMI